MKYQSIEEFDLYIDKEAIGFVPVFFYLCRNIPSKIYSNIECDTSVRVVHTSNERSIIKPLGKAEKLSSRRTIITVCTWNYAVMKKLASLNYNIISFSEIALYSLYKTVGK